MTEPVITAVPPEPGLLARLVGVFTSPRATFEGLAAAPRWVAPIVLIPLELLVVYFLFVRSEAGQEVLRQTIRGGSPNLPAEQVDQAMQIGQYTFSIFGSLGVALVIFVTAFVLYLIFNLASGGKGTYKQVLSVTAYGSVVHLVGAPLKVPLMAAQKSFEVSLGPALAFPDLEVGSFGLSALNTLDFFALWALALTGLGLSFVYRWPLRKSLLAVYIPYFVIFLGIAGIRSMI